MSAELNKLNDAYRAAAAELRSLSDHVTSEEREFTAEEEQTWQRINAHLDSIGARAEALTEAERRAAEIEAALSQYGAPEAPAAAVETDADVLRSMARGERRSAEFTKQEARVLTVGTSSAGGYAVPTNFYGAIVEAMKENSTVLAAEATLLETSHGQPVQVPTAASGSYPTASLVSEGSAIGASDPVLGQTTLNAYKYAFLTQVSSELLADEQVSIVDFLGRRGGEALGNGIGAAFITGTGSSQPTGIAGSAGFTTVASASGSVAAGFALNDVLTLVHSITRPYRAGASFICNDSVVLQLRKLKDTTGQYLWQPSVQAGQPDLLAGFPVYTDPAMATATTNGTKGLAFGNWKQGVIVRIAGGVRVESSSDFAFSSDLDTWRFIVRADARIVDAAAARVLTYTT